MRSARDAGDPPSLWKIFDLDYRSSVSHYTKLRLAWRADHVARFHTRWWRIMAVPQLGGMTGLFDPVYTFVTPRGGFVAVNKGGPRLNGQPLTAAERARRYRQRKRRQARLARLAVYFSSEGSAWETPQWLFDALHAEFHFELGVCALPENAKCPQYFTPADDSLQQPWRGVCYMNPPYGDEIAR
jgi:hypothetical protein